jgi:polyisoprenyl-teichoic acid--peptidoglycan teichoic acid transferase
MLPKKDSTVSSKPGLDWGAVLLIILALALSALVAVVTFRWSREFFASTTVIQVGDAPPVPLDPSPTPEVTSTSTGGEVNLTQAVTESAPGSAGQSNKVVKTTPWKGSGPVTVLVMGLDYRDWMEGIDIPRTDTMILLSIDPEKKTAGMMSIPRDMWVGIPGFGYSRINTAYRDGEMYKLPGGGIGLAMKTVEQFVGVPVDYAALIDFNAFVKFIDTLGGLDMHIKETIKVDPIGPGNTRILQPGVQTLDGATALAYARNRYTEDGDFDRAKRQQEVIMALRNQILNFNQLPVLIQNAPKLYHELSSGIRTNLTLDQVIQLALLAAQIDEKNIQRGVFDPHKDVQYASVMTRDGAASVLVPNPEQIRLLRDRVFGGSTLGPGAGGELVDLMNAENARVMVLNGTRKADQEKKAGDLLRSQGIDVTGEGSSKQAYSQTTFVDHSGKPYTIRYLIEVLKVPQSRIKVAFDPAASVDVEVMIGSDWTGSQP